MEVEYLLVARYAEHVEGSGLNVVGGFGEHVQVPGFPAHVPLFVAARLSLSREEAALSHKLRVRLVGPDNEPILETDDLPTPPKEVAPPFEYGHIQLTIGLMNVVVLQEGHVKLELLYDGEQVKETRLWFKSKIASSQSEMPSQVVPQGGVS